jgi:hypothetical protein
MIHAPYVGKRSCRQFYINNRTQVLELAQSSLDDIHER